jgi:HECT-domain (ubiquitin-transferase)
MALIFCLFALFSLVTAVSCPDDHLVYFRFIGRLVGRALFDRQLIKGHMVRMIYKHLLGWPITFEDVKAQDEEYYNSLKKLVDMEDVSLMCLDFTATEECMGVRVEKELVKDGAMKEVTNDNIEEYLEANIRYRMFNRTLPQLTELLLGFFDVVPEPPLTVFDANELELILCGLPEINIEDWMANTIYKGLFELEGRNHPVVKWFWEIVRDEFDQEMRARLLQFSTGTSGVPLRGFAYLQGIDGNIKKFTIQGVDRKMYMYPKSHTCFNRIDLPCYETKRELLETLTIAVTTSYVGFDIE